MSWAVLSYVLAPLVAMEMALLPARKSLISFTLVLFAGLHDVLCGVTRNPSSVRDHTSNFSSSFRGLPKGDFVPWEREKDNNTIGG